MPRTMRPSIQVRPRYRLGVCSRDEADRSASIPDDVRVKFSEPELFALSLLPARRRRDRIAGRLAAKRVLAAHFIEEHDADFEPGDLVVDNEPDGRPRLSLPSGVDVPIPAFSLSHGLEGGVCAVGGPGQRVGVDLEQIIPRPSAVIAFIATEEELSAAPPSQPEQQARLWTGKEAALKLLGLGLDADAHDVHFQRDEVIYAGVPHRVWTSLGSPRIRITYERAGAALIAVAYTGD